MEKTKPMAKYTEELLALTREAIENCEDPAAGVYLHQALGYLRQADNIFTKAPGWRHGAKFNPRQSQGEKDDQEVKEFSLVERSD